MTLQASYTSHERTLGEWVAIGIILAGAISLALRALGY